MAQKVNPNLYRLGIQQLWKSVNFLSAEPSRKILLEECFIRDVTSKFFRSFGVLVSDIIIQKSKIGPSKRGVFARAHARLRGGRRGMKRGPSVFLQGRLPLWREQNRPHGRLGLCLEASRYGLACVLVAIQQTRPDPSKSNLFHQIPNIFRQMGSCQHIAD